MPTPSRLLTHNGLTLTLKEWASRTGIGVEMIRSRLDHQGWDLSRALMTPADQRFGRSDRVKSRGPVPCPQVKRHRTSGRAYCVWQERGKQHFRYFGPWGSKEAQERFFRFQMEWSAGAYLGKRTSEVVVSELIERFLEHVTQYYVKNGKPTSEVGGQKAACDVLAALYSSLPVDKFSPACLRACQQAMVAKGWVRTSINRNIWRITRCFRWGVGQELVHPDVHARLKAVDHL